MSDNPTDTPVTPTEPVSTEPVNYLGEDGSIQWNNLPDDLGKHSIAQKYTNFTDLVKGTINANKLVGGKVEDFLKSEDEEIVAQRNEIMGIPADVSGYEYDPVEFPKEMNEEAVEGINQRTEQFKEVAKEIGLSASAVKKLIEWDHKGAVDQFESMLVAREAAVTQAQEELKKDKDWQGPKYDLNLGRVENALDQLGLGHWTEEPAFAMNPKFIKDAYEKLVPLVSDDQIIEGKQRENEATLSDTLDRLDEKARLYVENGGSQTSAEYKNIMKEKMNVLQKLG